MAKDAIKNLIAENAGSLVLKENPSFLLNQLAAEQLELGYYGRTYKFTGYKNNKWLAELKNKNQWIRGEFKFDLTGRDAYFVPDLEFLKKKNLNLCIEFVKRNFYADETLSNHEKNYFLQEKYKNPAVINTEEFNIVDKKTRMKSLNGEISSEEYIEIFEKAAGIKYSEKICELLKQRGAAQREWHKAGHILKRPVFKTRKDFHDFEEASLSEAEERHHRTNRGYKTLIVSETSFDEHVQLAESYITGVLDFSKARIRDVVNAVTNFVADHKKLKSKMPNQMAFLISPSFSSAIDQVKDFYGRNLKISEISLLEHFISAKESESAKFFPLQELRDGLLKGKINSSDHEFNILLAQDAVWNMLRSSLSFIEKSNFCSKSEIELLANTEARKLKNTEEARCFYEALREDMHIKAPVPVHAF